MADLVETTLSQTLVDGAQQFVYLPIGTTVNKDDIIYAIDGEGMRAQQAINSLGIVYVTRGISGQATAHGAGTPVLIGSANRFYGVDPYGLPAGVPINNPWVNLKDRRVWRAQGDQAGPGSLAVAHTWQLQVVTTLVGSLGVRQLVVTPNSTP
jgi:hypothetical protein